MKTFLSALIVVAAIGIASDFIFGGPVSQYESDDPILKHVFSGSATPLMDTSAASANTSPNVRLPGQGEGDAESE